MCHRQWPQHSSEVSTVTMSGKNQQHCQQLVCPTKPNPTPLSIPWSTSTSQDTGSTLHGLLTSQISRTSQVQHACTQSLQNISALHHTNDYADVQSCQSKDMDDKIKSYRQAIFKLDHAERKRGDVPASKRQSESLPFSPAALAVSRIMLSASSGCISCFNA